MTVQTKPEVATKGRDVQKIEPARALSPFDEMDRMFDGLLRGGWMRPWQWDWSNMPEMKAMGAKPPKVDVIDRETDVLVRAEVPGVDKKDLDISVTDNTVTIKGSTRHEEKEERGDYYRREIATGSFSRSLALPAEVDGSRAKADFKDGMLELTLPKAEKTKRHSIRVE